jgi:osmotically-inducible protein OsmY
MNEQIEYAVAELKRLLSEDDAVAEQGIDITHRSGALLLRGQVETSSRRDEIARRVASAFPDLRVENDIAVTGCPPPGEPEELS